MSRAPTALAVALALVAAGIAAPMASAAAAADATVDVTIETAPAEAPPGGNATLNYTVENTGSAPLDALVVNATAGADDATVVNATSADASAVQGADTVRFGSIAPGETVTATVTVAVDETAAGERTVTATATGTAGNDVVTRRADAEVRVRAADRGAARLVDADLSPGRVADDRPGTGTHTLRVEATGVSDDGEPDAIVVNAPRPIESVSLGDVSVTDAGGEPVPLAGVDVAGSILLVEMSPDSNAATRVLSAEIDLGLAVPDVDGNRTADVTVSLRDSRSGTDSTVVPLTIVDAAQQPEGSVVVADQTVERGAGTVTVAAANASADYCIEVRTADGRMLGTSRTFEAHEARTDVAVDLSRELAANTTVVATVHAVGSGAEPAADSAQVVIAPPDPVDRVPSTDPDGDGLAEDVDGNGAFEYADVRFFIDNFRRDTIREHAPAFDLDGDGEVTVFDVQWLLDELQAQQR